MLKSVVVSTALCFQMHLGVPYSHLIHQYACPRHINPVLVASIIKVESNFHPKAFHRENSHEASRGLMQIESGTARLVGYRGPIRNLFHPDTNIRTGVTYLVRLSHRYRTLGSVISAYNAGTAVWIPHYGFLNQDYVQRVLHTFLSILRTHPFKEDTR